MLLRALKRIFTYLLTSTVLIICSLPSDAEGRSDSLCLNINKGANKEATTKRIVLSPRTNLLLPLLNVGVDVPIGKHLSVACDAYYPWLGHDKANTRCIQALLGNVQMRWWLNPKEYDSLEGNSLTGSALSLGAMAGKYDFECDRDGFQGEIYGVYLDYSYTFVLGRSCRLSLSIGAGWARLPYRDYTVYSDGGKLIRDDANFDRVKQWYGPLHAGVMLSVPITKKKAR